MFSPRPPHHPACGSAPGGSSSRGRRSRLRLVSHDQLGVQGWLRGRTPPSGSPGRVRRRWRVHHDSSLRVEVRAFSGVRPSGSSPARCDRLLCPLLTPARSPDGLPRPALSSVSDVSPGLASLGSLAAWRRPATRGAWTWSAGSPPASCPLETPIPWTAPSGRSPRIRTWTCAAPPRHLPCPSDRWASSCCADSPLELGLLWRFCSSARSFAAGFLRTPPRGGALALG